MSGKLETWPNSDCHRCTWCPAIWTGQEGARESALVAFDVLNPRLRSRGVANGSAQELYAKAPFKAEMSKLFQGSAHGSLQVVSLENITKQLAALEKRLKVVEESRKSK